ncbi:MAG: RidA family protein [Boseongicola sp.]
MRELNPRSIAPPFARYAHGVLIPNGATLICTSGQLGMAVDGTVPDSVGSQAEICFANIDAILSESGADRSNVIRVNAYVTDRNHMADYMEARDRWLASVKRLPASTLMIVSGFTRPEFLVEVEVLAAKIAEA